MESETLALTVMTRGRPFLIFLARILGLGVLLPSAPTLAADPPATCDPECGSGFHCDSGECRRVGHVFLGAGGAFGAGSAVGSEFRPEAYGIIGYGLTVGLDAELLPAMAVPILKDGVGFNVGIEPRLLFHLGSIYTMALGVNFMLGRGGQELRSEAYGTRTTSKTSVAPPWRAFEARVSPAGFQFGRNREHHLETYGWLGLLTVENVNRMSEYAGNQENQTVTRTDQDYELRIGAGLRYAFVFSFL